jgi:hypothetical protein
MKLLVPIAPDWQALMLDLYKAYGTYHAILNALADQGAAPCDHSVLCYIRNGKRKHISWELGAGLMNLWVQLRR